MFACLIVDSTLDSFQYPRRLPTHLAGVVLVLFLWTTSITGGQQPLVSFTVYNATESYNTVHLKLGICRLNKAVSSLSKVEVCNAGRSCSLRLHAIRVSCASVVGVLCMKAVGKRSATVVSFLMASSSFDGDSGYLWQEVRRRTGKGHSVTTRSNSVVPRSCRIALLSAQVLSNWPLFSTIHT